MRDKEYEESCYIISIYPDIDGKIMNRAEAVSTIVGRGLASIILFSNLAVIETEQVVGSATKYILYSE